MLYALQIDTVLHNFIDIKIIIFIILIKIRMKPISLSCRS